MSNLILEGGGQPYLNFINSRKSKETKREYRYALLKFDKHCNTTLEGLLVPSPRDIEQKISNYVTNMNARGLSCGYINLATYVRDREKVMRGLKKNETPILKG